MRRTVVVLAAIAFALHAAASPEIERVSTLALKGKGETEITLFGSNLRETASLWLSIPAEAKLFGAPRDNEVKFRISLRTNVAQRVVWARVVASNGISNVRGFVIDELKTKAASQTNRTRLAAQTLAMPIAVESAAEELNVAWFRITATKRQAISLEVVATRLGSRLDSVLRVVDSRGRDVASNDDAPGLRGDSVLMFEAPEAGEYFVELRDVNYAGGRDYFYRLRVGAEPLPQLAPACDQQESEPNNTAKLATAISVPGTVGGRFDSAKDIDVFRFTAKTKQEVRFRARTRSIGAACDVMLRVENAKGEVLAKSNVSAADEGMVTHAFADGGEYRLAVQEVTGAFGPTTFYLIDAAESAGFALTLDTDRVEAPSEGGFKLKVNCVRAGYKGPVTLALSGLDGVTLTNNVIAQNATNVTLTATVPKSLDPATTHLFKVTGVVTSRTNSPTITASTAPAWQKAFPQMLYAPPKLEQFVVLGITSK